MGTCAGIVLAGGRSTRMGAPKATLEWHGSTLLRRVAGIVARGVDGPVVVVRAPGQELPDAGPEVEVTTDARDGRGPLQGLAAGLAAVGDRAEVAYVSATDVPLLHPAFVRRVVDLIEADTDVALPIVHGHPQPLAAAYRTSLLPLVQELLGVDRLRHAFLYERCRVRRLTESLLARDSRLSALDGDLLSVQSLNHRADYERARALPEPEIEIESVAKSPLGWGAGRHTINACTLGRAAAALGLGLDSHAAVLLNGQPIGTDPQFPLVAGDRLAFPGSERSGEYGASRRVASGQ